MALPTSPDTTYVASSTPAFKAADENDVQTWLAFVYNNRYALITGDGSDGAATLDGTATVAWATKVGSVYTMTRHASCTSLQINNGVTLNTGGWILFCTTSFTHQSGGIIACNGSAGGVARATAGYLNINGAGGGGGTTVGSPSTNLINYSYGAAGGNGGTGSSGIGGTAGTAGGASKHLLATQFALGFVMLTGTQQMLSGGSGGGGGGGDGTAGGAGGEGGGLIMIFAQSIVLNGGTAQCTGGAGTAAGAGNRGGGAGGGGGAVILVSPSVTGSLTVTATGGAGGAGTGTGTAGGSGTNGSSSPITVALI